LNSALLRYNSEMCRSQSTFGPAISARTDFGPTEPIDKDQGYFGGYGIRVLGFGN
jgi:hypothetical protein